MKRRIVKKLLCLTIAASMLFGLTACGTSEGAGPESKDEATVGEAVTEETDKGQEGITLTTAGYDARYFDEEGNMKLPLTDGSYTYKILWKKFATDVGTPEDKYMLQQALEATGIKVEIEEVSEQA